MTKDEIKQKAQDIYTLASHCKVPMLRACQAIGMATSTPHRWLRDGSEPEPGATHRLRGSILIIAEKGGTLPDKHRADLLAISDDIAEQAKYRSANAIVRDILRNARELEQSLAAQG